MSSSDNSAAKPDGASFLSRWSQRKIEAKSEPTPNVETQKSSFGAVPGAKVPETPHPEPTSPVEPHAKQELPDIATLTHEGDFLPFMAKDVDPGLRNEAMKKLFTDPHYRFEQMDKLDIYIDDYSIENPIPMDILRKMNQAKSLGLFDDEDEEKAPKGVVGDTPPADLDVPDESPPLPAEVEEPATGNALPADKLPPQITELPPATS